MLGGHNWGNCPLEDTRYRGEDLWSVNFSLNFLKSKLAMKNVSQSKKMCYRCQLEVLLAKMTDSIASISWILLYYAWKYSVLFSNTFLDILFEALYQDNLHLLQRQICIALNIIWVNIFILPI